MEKREKRLDDIVADHGGNVIRIVHSEDGGPLRLIINGRHVKPTGRYPSYKGRRSFGYEADHEMGLLEHCDADAAVVSCLSQPHRVIIPVPWQARPLIYIPDLRRDLAARTVEIFETKHDDDRRLRDPHYQFKLDVVNEVYRTLGWKFRILRRAEIMDTCLYRNVHEVATWAFAKVPTASKFALREAIYAAGDALACARAAEIVGGVPRLHALVVQRFVRFDLTVPIDDDNPVHYVDRNALRRNSPPLL
jgi:hypothetical protein